jgi:hypothetical protein
VCLCSTTTLETVSTPRTRLEQDFDSEAVRAIKAGLVDELHLFLSPVVVGGGKASLPDSVRLKLELLDERRFGNGTVHLHYRTTK